MKKIILATIPAITLGVAIAPEVNAEEKNYESNAIVEFTPDASINKPVDPVNPDTKNLLNPLIQRHQTQAISQMKEQLVH